MAVAAVRASVVLLAALAVSVLGVAGCTFDPSGYGASIRFDADVDAIPGDAGPADAPPSDGVPADASDCPPACTFCRPDGTCQIDCAAGQCAGGVTCPPGRPCDVHCIGPLACAGGLIDCTAATSCAIVCRGDAACDQGVRCDGSACSVTCDGIDACEVMGVECNADSCEITCTGEDACASHVCCEGVACDSACTSSNGGCCSCSGC